MAAFGAARRWQIAAAEHVAARAVHGVPAASGAADGERAWGYWHKRHLLGRHYGPRKRALCPLAGGGKLVFVFVFVLVLGCCFTYKTNKKRIIRRMNEVHYASKAAKQLRKLQALDSKAVRAECNKLAYMPDCTNVKALVNHEHQYRLRVGNFRVFFDFDGVARIVSIEEVKKRDERTY